MKKTNTYFASASWYDDDDSEVCYRREYKQRSARRIPCRSNLWSDSYVNGGGCSYILKDQKRIEEIKKHNKRRNILWNQFCKDNGVLY